MFHCFSDRYFSASSAAMQPEPAEVIAELEDHCADLNAFLGHLITFQNFMDFLMENAITNMFFKIDPLSCRDLEIDMRSAQNGFLKAKM